MRLHYVFEVYRIAQILLIKFWVKLNLETPIPNPESFIHHGQPSDEEKSLIVRGIDEKHL